MDFDYWFSWDTVFTPAIDMTITIVLGGIAGLTTLVAIIDYFVLRAEITLSEYQELKRKLMKGGLSNEPQEVFEKALTKKGYINGGDLIQLKSLIEKEVKCINEFEKSNQINKITEEILEKAK